MSSSQRLCVSADSHVVEPPELFAPLENRFGERAPRIVFTEENGHQLDLGNGQRGFPIGGFLIAGLDVGSPETRAMKRQGYGIARPGVYDIAARLADQDQDGVTAEVLYPSILFSVYQIEDTEIVKATFAAYNDWLAGYISQAPTRLFGLGAVQLRDLDAAIAEMERVKRMGFVGLAIPATAPPEKPYSDPFYDGFWAAAQDAHMPLTMHIFTGATPNHGLPQWQALSYPLAHVGIALSIGDLILSGVCARFPRLRFVPTEFETGWLGHFLQRLDWSYYRFGGAVRSDVKLSMKPSEYWKRNFLITFEDDEIGIRTRDLIGVDNLMWGSDYPHGDSIFPESQSVLERIFRGVADQDRHAITVANVCKLYNLPLDY